VSFLFFYTNIFLKPRSYLEQKLVANDKTDNYENYHNYICSVFAFYNTSIDKPVGKYRIRLCLIGWWHLFYLNLYTLIIAPLR